MDTGAAAAAAQTASLVNFVTCPGEDTTEHQAHSALTLSGRIQKWVGVLIAAVPQVLDMLNALPDAVKQSKVPQICLAGLGTVMAIRGILTETQAKIAYINGRALIKGKAAEVLAAAQSPATVVTASPAPATVVTATALPSFGQQA